MFKIPKQEYTAEFKEGAVQRVLSGGEGVPAVAKDLGLVEQRLRNWVKAAKAGKLHPVGGKKVTPEQTELSRVRAETEGTSPFRFFKYRKINDHLTESLGKSTLWFAKPEKLNDPFDCQLDLRKSWIRAQELSAGRRKRWLQSALDNPVFLDSWNGHFEKVGVCSFSLELYNSLLWSHYADEHRGVCLLYEFPESFLDDPKNIFGVTKVTYVPNQLTNWLISESPTNLAAFVPELIKIYLSAKAPEWEYERESRIIRKEHGEFKIPPEFLIQVCFGLRTPQAEIERITELVKRNSACKNLCRIVRDKSSDFGITADKI